MAIANGFTNPAMAFDLMPMEQRLNSIDSMYKTALSTLRFCKVDELDFFIDGKNPNTPLQAACKRFEQSYKVYLKKAYDTLDWDDFLANSAAFVEEINALGDLKDEQNKYRYIN